jgi:hypothetical protein
MVYCTNRATSNNRFISRTLATLSRGMLADNAVKSYIYVETLYRILHFGNIPTVAGLFNSLISIDIMMMAQ